MDSSPPDPPIARPLTFFTASIWTLIAMMSNVLVVSITESGREGAVVDPVSRTACLTLSYSVVLFGVLRVHEPQSSIRHVLGARRTSVVLILLALVLGAALTLPSDFLDNALAARFPTSAEDADAADAALAVTTLGKRIALFVTLGLLQPVLTELFFRGVLFTPLRKTRRVETVILAAAAFETLSNLSWSPRSSVALLGATLVFSWLRGVSGSIWPPIAAHLAFYGVSVVPIVLGRAELAPTKPLLATSALAAVVGLFGTAFFARGERAADARQRDAAGSDA